MAGAGGGLHDEYNRPLDVMAQIYGIKGQKQYAAEQGQEYVPGQIYADGSRDNQLEKVAQDLRAKVELIHAHPLDHITLEGGKQGKLPVLGYRQRFTVADGGAAGTFDDGRCAVVTNTFGQGRAIIAGFLPGISYFYQAFPKKPYGRGGEDLSMALYPQCKPLVREAMTGLMGDPLLKNLMPARASNPMVETNLLRDGDRYYLALVNFSGVPQKNLRVTLNPALCGKARKARATYGKLSVGNADDSVELTMNLDKFDWIVLEP